MRLRPRLQPRLETMKAPGGTGSPADGASLRAAERSLGRHPCLKTAKVKPKKGK